MTLGCGRAKAARRNVFSIPERRDVPRPEDFHDPPSCSRHRRGAGDRSPRRGTGTSTIGARAQSRPPAPAGRLTIDKLIDIKHPSNPNLVARQQEDALSGVASVRASRISMSCRRMDRPNPLRSPRTDSRWPAWRGARIRARSTSREVAHGWCRRRVVSHRSPCGTRCPGARSRSRRAERSIAYLVGGAAGAGGGGRGGRGGRGGGRHPRQRPTPQAPPPPTEIHVRSLADANDRIVATTAVPSAQ